MAEFEILGIELRRGARFTQRRNYGGNFDALHLEGNSHRRVPFTIRLPAGLDLRELAAGGYRGRIKFHLGRMEAEGGVDFPHIQLIIMHGHPPQGAPRARVVIARVAGDDLPLTECPLGFRLGAATVNDPHVIASHTMDGQGWYTYHLWLEEEVS